MPELRDATPNDRYRSDTYYRTVHGHAWVDGSDHVLTCLTYHANFNWRMSIGHGTPICTASNNAQVAHVHVTVRMSGQRFRRPPPPGLQ